MARARMPGSLPRSIHPSGKDCPCQSGLFKTVDPPGQAALRPRRDLVILLRRRGEQIDVPEGVVRRKQGIGSVQQGLHLPAHLVVINGGGKGDDLCPAHFLRDLHCVVLDHTLAGALTGQTARAEGDGSSPQGDLLHLVTRLPRASGKGVPQGLGVALLPQAGADDQNAF